MVQGVAAEARLELRLHVRQDEVRRLDREGWRLTTPSGAAFAASIALRSGVK